MSESPDNKSSKPIAPWALVTGASAGIGKAFCRALAAHGYRLVLVARRRERLQALADSLRQESGTECVVLPADLARAGASAAIVADLAARGISIEFLVNNAGYGVPGRFVEPDWQQHEDFIQVMMTAVCELTWHLLPDMQKKGKGYVINVASVAGLIPGSEGHTLYGASKSFLIRFSESLALENRYFGVNISALCPGFTYSEFHDVTGTRDLVNKLPRYMWLDADFVVDYAIESVTRNKPRFIAIPGMFYRILVRLNRYLPGFGNWTTRRMSNRFRKLDQP